MDNAPPPRARYAGPYWTSFGWCSTPTDSLCRRSPWFVNEPGAPSTPNLLALVYWTMRPTFTSKSSRTTFSFGNAAHSFNATQNSAGDKPIVSTPILLRRDTAPRRPRGHLAHLVPLRHLRGCCGRRPARGPPRVPPRVRRRHLHVRRVHAFARPSSRSRVPRRRALLHRRLSCCREAGRSHSSRGRGAGVEEGLRDRRPSAQGSGGLP